MTSQWNQNVNHFSSESVRCWGSLSHSENELLLGKDAHPSMSGVKSTHSITLNNLLKLHYCASLNQIEARPSEMFREIHFQAWCVCADGANKNSHHLGDWTTFGGLLRIFPEIWCWGLTFQCAKGISLPKETSTEEGWEKLKDYSRSKGQHVKALWRINLKDNEKKQGQNV